MRHLNAVLVLALAMGGLSACQQQSDPELRAAITALASNQAARPAGADASADALKPQLDAIKESIRELRQAQQDDSRKSKADLSTEIASLMSKVQELDRRMQSGEAAAVTTREAATGAKTDAASALTALSGIKVALDDLAAKVKGSDPAEYLKLIREIGEKERQIANVEGERDKAKADMDAVNAKVAELQGSIDTLKAEMAQMGGADISKHPQFVEQRKKLQDAEAERRNLQKEYDQLKVLVDDMRKTGVVGGTPAATGDAAKPATPAEPYVAGFEATVGTATYNPEAQKHVIIAKIKDGAAPTVGEVLDIVNDKGEKVCAFRVMTIYEDNSFGGMRTDSAITPAPTRGDRVLRPRSTEARGN